MDVAYYFDFISASKFSKVQYAETVQCSNDNCSAWSYGLQFYSVKKPLTCEIDSFGDFLQALGPEATKDASFVCFVKQLPL